MIKWPEWVPVLEAGDFCRGKYALGEKACLLGWSTRVFGNHRRHAEADIAIENALAEMGHFGRISCLNDTKPFPEVARAWNKAMASLGYVVGNPEAKEGKG